MHITHFPPYPLLLSMHWYFALTLLLQQTYPVTDRIIVIVYVANDGSAVTKDPDLEKINVYGGAQFLIITHVSLLAK